MTSLTSTAHASTSGRRHGRSRAAVAYQSTIASPVSGSADGAAVTGTQSARPGDRRAAAGGERPGR